MKMILWVCLLAVPSWAAPDDALRPRETPNKDAEVTPSEGAGVTPKNDAEVRKYELRVVGVYRPIALKGRTIDTPREVYLQPLSASGPIDALIGETLDVHRRVPVPASVDFTPKPMAKPDAEKPKKKRKQRRLTRAEKRALAASRAKKAAKAAKAPVKPKVESITRPGPVPVKTAAIEVLVAQVKVVEVRSGIVVAHATTPMGDAQAVAGALPAVMAGDIARLEVLPPAAPPPPPLTPKEKAILDADRKVLEKEDRRRRNPPTKYQRPNVRWKL